MSSIKTRVVFLEVGENQPLFTTDFDYLSKIKISEENHTASVHKLSQGKEFDLEGSRYEIVDISSNLFEQEYGNEGIMLNCQGERNPYNFDIVYKLKRK